LTFNKPVRKALLLLFVPTVLAAQDSKLDSVAIQQARNVLVSQLDPKLPRINFSEWLKMEAGPAASISWDTNDCGEQTGDTATNPKEIPICAEATAKMHDGRTIVVWLAVGTNLKGLMGKTEAASITVGDKPLAHLSDIPLELKKFQEKPGVKPKL
jgi:hypothetical protein